jgi:hypothetical protein
MAVPGLCWKAEPVVGAYDCLYKVPKFNYSLVHSKERERESKNSRCRLKPRIMNHKNGCRALSCRRRVDEMEVVLCGAYDHVGWDAVWRCSLQGPCQALGWFLRDEIHVVLVEAVDDFCVVVYDCIVLFLGKGPV